MVLPTSALKCVHHYSETGSRSNIKEAYAHWKTQTRHNSFLIAHFGVFFHLIWPCLDDSSDICDWKWGLICPKNCWLPPWKLLLKQPAQNTPLLNQQCSVWTQLCTERRNDSVLSWVCMANSISAAQNWEGKLKGSKFMVYMTNSSTGFDFLMNKDSECQCWWWVLRRCGSDEWCSPRECPGSYIVY